MCEREVESDSVLTIFLFVTRYFPLSRGCAQARDKATTYIVQWASGWLALGGAGGGGSRVFLTVFLVFSFSVCSLVYVRSFLSGKKKLGGAGSGWWWWW